MSKKLYPIREFVVISRTDYDNININCNHYLATMYNDFSIQVDEKLYTNNEFNKIYTENVI